MLGESNRKECIEDFTKPQFRRGSKKGSVYQEFKEKLTIRQNEQYETSLPWKANHLELPINYQVAKWRFQSLTNPLEKQPEIVESYHSIIVNQQEEQVIEISPKKPQGSCEHYLHINLSYVRKPRLRN